MMKNTLLALLLIFISVNLNAQIDSSKVNLSPYGVIYNHLLYLQDDSYQPERAAISFPEGTVKRDQVAIQLKKVLDGRGFFVDINRLPKENDYFDTLARENIYFIDRDEPRIYLEQVNGKWYYSESTITQVPQMFKEVFPFGTGFFKKFHGPVWDYEILDLTVFKWLGLFVLFILTVLTFYVVNSLARWLATSFLRKRFDIPDIVNEDLRRLARAIALLISVRLLLFLIPMFQLPIRFNANLIKVLGVLSIFFIILSITKALHILFHYLDIFSRKTKNTLDDQLMPALRRIVDIIIWSVGIIYVLDFLDVNVTALLAGISIGGLAIALAAQDTVKNFFGSIMIFIDRPFQIGDWINFDDVDGTVEEVGIRSTRIRSFANSVIYVPNGMLTNKVVNNWGLRQYRRFKTTLGLSYSTPPEKINLFVEGVRKIIEKHHTTRKDYFEVHLNSFGESSINILLYCFFEARDWNEELVGRHEIMYAIMLLMKDLGISFAFPSQSIYIESMPSEEKKALDKDSGQDVLNNSMDRIDEYFGKSRADRRQDKFKPLGGE